MNGIVEEIVEKWLSTRELDIGRLPENPSVVSEIIDSINDKIFPKLVLALRQYRNNLQ